MDLSAPATQPNQLDCLLGLWKYRGSGSSSNANLQSVAISKQWFEVKLTDVVGTEIGIHAY